MTPSATLAVWHEQRQQRIASGIVVDADLRLMATDGVGHALAAASGTEPRDEAWKIIGLDGDSPAQAGWWPKGGAVWDAGAQVHGPDGQLGGILAEAKGREGELTSGGCKATAEQSIKAIRSALADVQNEFGIAPSPEWMGPCYQPANRLAVLWYARIRCQPPVPLWLVSLYFAASTTRPSPAS